MFVCLSFPDEDTMNRFGKVSLMLLVAVACRVHAQKVPTSTPCSLSFYRYLYNLPGEQIRPDVPEGTYVFGKRVGPPGRPSQEGQASDLRPAFLRPAPSYDAPQYLPPPKQPSTTTTTAKPSTAAPVYIPPPPPPSPIYPAESVNNAVTVVGPSKPNCDCPEHVRQAPVDSELLPPYRFQPPLPDRRPQPTIAVPRFSPPPKISVVIDDNEIFGAGRQQPVTIPPPPPPQLIVHPPRPYGKSHEHENCEKPRPAPTTTSTTTTTTTTTTTEAPTTAEVVVETRQNEIVASPHYRRPDCEHEHAEQAPQESLGVPSTDYGVVPVQQVPEQAPSAGYHYDVPSGQPFVYESAAAAIVNGYTYPKASPSFEYPGGYPSQGTALFESDPSKPPGAEDGNLIILKV